MGDTLRRKRPLLGSLAMGALAGLTLSGCTKIHARDLIREGNALYDAGRYTEAIDRYDESEKVDPEVDAKLFRNRAFAAEAQVLRMKQPSEKDERHKYADRALRDLQSWYERLEAKTEADATTLHDHRLALLKADERCDDLLSYWLDKHNSNPNDERLYVKVGQQYDECGQPEKYLEWLKKRTEDFPNSLQAWHTLATIRFMEIMPTIDDTQGFVATMAPEDRMRVADEVIELLGRVTKIDPKFADAFRWRAMAYTQRQLAHQQLSGDSAPADQSTQERLEVILARQDNMLAWKEQKAVCDLEGRAECPATVTPETPPCCPASPFSIEEQKADETLKQQFEQELAAAAAGISSGKKRRGKRG